MLLFCFNSYLCAQKVQDNNDQKKGSFGVEVGLSVQDFSSITSSSSTPSLTARFNYRYFVKDWFFVEPSISYAVTRRDLLYLKLSPEITANVYTQLGNMGLFAGAGPTYQLAAFEDPDFGARGPGFLFQAGTGKMIRGDFYQLKFQVDLVWTKRNTFGNLNYEIFSILIGRYF